jgi:hypothetical protein
MPGPVMVAFAAGVLTCGYFLVGCFFMRFWVRARDFLFLIFAGAFFLLAANQALPILLGIPREEQGGVYLLRAAGFALIIIAILVKNIGADKPRRGAIDL